MSHSWSTGIRRAPGVAAGCTGIRGSQSSANGTPARAELAALLATREIAAQHLHDAEGALHIAHQAARGATTSAEAHQCGRWVAAAYTHLHDAAAEYTTGTAAVE